MRDGKFKEVQELERMFKENIEDIGEPADQLPKSVQCKDWQEE